jgi:hypothetical protein
VQGGGAAQGGWGSAHPRKIGTAAAGGGVQAVVSDPTLFESRPETASSSGASLVGFFEGTKSKSQPLRGRLDRHRGVTFVQMQSIFDVLVRDCCDHNSQQMPFSFADAS